jgi:hypothetical protein
MTAPTDAGAPGFTLPTKPAKAPELATVPTPRLATLTGALWEAGDLAHAWRSEATERASGSLLSLQGVLGRVRAVVLAECADRLQVVLTAALRTERLAAQRTTPSTKPVQALVLAAIAEKIEHLTRRDLEVAQATVDAVAPLAYARGVAAVRGALLANGWHDAVASLDEEGAS